jgi:hypothetical protein
VRVKKDIILAVAFAFGRAATSAGVAGFLSALSLSCFHHIYLFYALIGSLVMGGLSWYFPGVIIGAYLTAIAEIALSLAKALCAYFRVHLQFVEDDLRHSLRYAPSVRLFTRRH